MLDYFRTKRRKAGDAIKGVDKSKVDCALEKAREVSGLIADFDEIEYLNYDLDVTAREQTKLTTGKETLQVGRDFYDLPEPHRVTTMLHEMLHCINSKSRLDKVLEEKYDAPEVGEAMRTQYEDRVNPLVGVRWKQTPEGMIQLLTEKLVGNEEFFHGESYPMRAEFREQKIEGKGLSLDKLSNDKILQLVFWPSEASVGSLNEEGERLYEDVDVKVASRVVDSDWRQNVFLGGADERLQSFYEQQKED